MKELTGRWKWSKKQQALVWRWKRRKVEDMAWPKPAETLPSTRRKAGVADRLPRERDE